MQFQQQALFCQNRFNQTKFNDKNSWQQRERQREVNKICNSIVSVTNNLWLFNLIQLHSCSRHIADCSTLDGTVNFECNTEMCGCTHQK